MMSQLPCIPPLRHCLQEWSNHPEQRAVFDHATTELLAWTLTDPDTALYNIVRLQRSALSDYGFIHSIHTATLAVLMAERMDYPKAAMLPLLRAALTCNLSILKQQGDWSKQSTPLSQWEHMRISTHGQDSADILERSGIVDQKWIACVRHHHDVLPKCDWARIVHISDVYSASVSPRLTRDALNSSEALSQTMKLVGADRFGVILYKVLGLYPPGSVVKSREGERGVVLSRALDGCCANMRIWKIQDSYLDTPIEKYVDIERSIRDPRILEMNDRWDVQCSHQDVGVDISNASMVCTA